MLRYLAHTARLSLAAVLLCAAAAPALAQRAARLTPEGLAAPGGVALAAGWRYRAGDDPAWAAPDLDDSGWEELAGTSLRGRELPATGWPGVGWFRLRVEVDPALAGVPVALRMSQLGASEIYVDGTLAGRYGRVGATPEAERGYDPMEAPLPVVFASGGEHLLAVRYSCAEGVSGFSSIFPTALFRPGFALSAAEAAPAVAEYGAGMRMRTALATGFFGLLVAFGLLHLLLYAFYRAERANLYYALFAFAFAANALFGMVINVTTAGMRGTTLATLGSRLTVVALFLTLLAFLHEAFRFPLPRYFRWLAALWAVAYLSIFVARYSFALAFVFPVAIFLSVTAIMLAIARALRLRLDGAWIIHAAVQCYSLAFGFQFAQGFLPSYAWLFTPLSYAGFVGLPLFVSVYLARGFAKTNRELAAKLVEVEELSARTLEQERHAAEVAIQREQERARVALLEAENERRARELEEARQLQLSMLPSRVPELPHLEIAAYMKPATEVGGDYYDFHLAADGTLTVAVGDATGHGLKAGTLVTATKGLFNAFGAEPDIARFLRESSLAIKRLNLRHLYMALTVAKIQGNRVRVSAAGMPPVLVHRAATGEVDEVKIAGMPLGGVAFPYQERELELGPGDTLVLMSDGFPERFNADGEMLDYDRARAVLREAAGLPPAEVVERFVSAGEEWAAGRPQDDDVTFVVVRAGEPAR